MQDSATGTLITLGRRSARAAAAVGDRPARWLPLAAVLLGAGALAVSAAPLLRLRPARRLAGAVVGALLARVAGRRLD